jgi:hypothetical protein
LNGNTKFFVFIGAADTGSGETGIEAYTIDKATLEFSAITTIQDDATYFAYWFDAVYDFDQEDRAILGARTIMNETI